MDQNKVDIPVWGGYDRKQETGGGGSTTTSYRYYRISLSEVGSLSEEFSSILLYYPTACCGYFTDGNAPFRDFNVGWTLAMQPAGTLSDLLYVKDPMVSCAFAPQSDKFLAGNSIIEFAESLVSQDPTIADAVSYLKDHEISEEEYNAYADSLFNNN